MDHTNLIEARKAKQVEMALRKGRSAPNDFREGDLLVVQDLLCRKWNIPGTIKQARFSEDDDDTARSFIIERSDGSSLLRNSKYIKHQWTSPRMHVSWADVSGADADKDTEQPADPAL